MTQVQKSEFYNKINQIRPNSFLNVTKSEYSDRIRVFGTTAMLGGVVAPVVMSGMWARAELPGDTTIAAAAVVAVGTPAVCV